MVIAHSISLSLRRLFLTWLAYYDQNEHRGPKCGLDLSLSLMQDATLYVGNLDDKVSDALLWEFMLQAGYSRQLCY